jgi:acetyl esterase
MARMALRTRIFARLMERTSRPIESVTDYPAQRAARRRLQTNVVGRFVFGTSDRAASVEEITAAGGRRALVHRPKGATGPLPCVLNLHGGGWVQGNPEQSAWLASRVAARAGVVVVSPAYRLAPEHVFPAAVDDCWESLRWVVEHADALGIDPTRLAVMGDSAGGNLAAVLALLARDAGGPALRAQVLIYPSVEMYETYPSELRNATAPVLTSVNMHAYAHLYLGDAYGTDDFRASPLRAASHAGLPPALLVTASEDPLADQGPRYRDALVAAGVPVTLVDHPGAVHGFLSLPGMVPAARQALDDVVGFLTRVL